MSGYVPTTEEVRAQMVKAGEVEWTGDYRRPGRTRERVWGLT